MSNEVDLKNYWLIPQGNWQELRKDIILVDIPVTEQTEHCEFCNGRLICYRCNGDKECDECEEGIDECDCCGHEADCVYCQGSGKCPECKGTGLCPKCCIPNEEKDGK